MMARMDEISLAWLAGLLEGEGYFALSQGNPVIRVNMTDRDVIERVADLMGGSVLGPYGEGRGGNPNARPYFTTSATGERALSLMSDLKPYLFQRRLEQIDGVLSGLVEAQEARLAKKQAQAREKELVLERQAQFREANRLAREELLDRVTAENAS